MIPRAFPGDTAVTGEGRVFALHMFDALVECEATITYHLADGRTRADPLDETKRMPHRSRCDPMIYFDMAKNECGHIGASAARPRPQFADVVDLDVSLRSKRNSDAACHQVVDIPNFCAANPSYDMWRHNAWIRLE